MRQGEQKSDHLSGFTLIEMLVVLSIIGLLAYVSVVNFRPASDRVDIVKINREISRMAQLVRLKALNDGSPGELLFDLEKRTVLAARNDDILKIPASVTVQVLTGAELVRAREKASIAFLPDGSSSGGEVRLTDASGGRSTLSINWLTGIPTILANDQP